MERKQWKPIKLGKRGLPLSHLFFADDLLLFSYADDEQVALIKNILTKFAISSGHLVNDTKTRVFFSKNVHASRAVHLSSQLEFTLSNDLGKYLGTPLLLRRPTKHTYNDMVEKVTKRLSGWNASTLSLAGRTTLTQAVLQAIPLYTMQTSMIPLSICDKLDMHCRSFVWGSNRQHKHVHLVDWKTLCDPRDNGGLGLKDLE